MFLIADFSDAVEESNESNNVLLIAAANDSVLFTLELPVQWNLVSFPINLSNKTIEAFAAEFNISFVYQYNETSTGFDVFKNATNLTLSSFADDGGYWVKPNVGGNFTLQGLNYSYPITYQLFTGWNLLSYPSLISSSVMDTLASVNSTLTQLYSYQNNTWLTFNVLRNQSLNELKTFSPGFGYFVNVEENVNWTFNGSYH